MDLAHTHPSNSLTFVSLAATVIFGIWGVLSYKATLKGNNIASLALQQAVIQNQLALLSWCEGVKEDSSEAILYTCTRFAKSLSVPTLASILSASSPASIPLEWAPPPYYTLTPPPPQFWEKKPRWWPQWLDGNTPPRWRDTAPEWWPSWPNNWIVELLPYVGIMYLVFRVSRQVFREVNRRQDG